MHTVMNPKNFIISPYDEIVRDGQIYLHLDIDIDNSYSREVDTPAVDKLEMFPDLEPGSPVEENAKHPEGWIYLKIDRDADHSVKINRRLFGATMNDIKPVSSHEGLFQDEPVNCSSTVVLRSTRIIACDINQSFTAHNFIDHSIPVIYRSPI